MEDSEVEAIASILEYRADEATRLAFTAGAVLTRDVLIGSAGAYAAAANLIREHLANPLDRSDAALEAETAADLAAESRALKIAGA